MLRLMVLLVVLVGLAAVIETGRSRDGGPTHARPAEATAPALPPAADGPGGGDRLGDDVARLVARLEQGGGTLTAVTGSALARAEAEAMAALAAEGAPMLAAWIDRSRAAVLATGTEPIPAGIRASLARHYPAEVLKGIRYRVGWSDPGSLPGRLFAAYGQAMTLGEVIVFRTEEIARDPVIWAHEVAHVQQYRRWGIDEFARRYVADHRAVERDAWQETGRWAKRQGDPPTASR